MKRISLRVIVALVTFSFGLGAVALWVNQRSATVVEPLAPACCSAKLESQVPRGFPADDFYFRAGTFLPDELRDREFAKWYARSLTALAEPSLYALADTNLETYRLLWLRSFHPAVSIRVWKCERGYCMSVRQLDSLDEYVNGQFLPTAKLSVSYTRPLNFDEWNNFIHLLERASFWSMPTVDGKPLPNDGAVWALEGVKDSKYHIVDRLSPEDGSYRDAGVYLIKLSGLAVDEAKDELY